MGLKTIVVVVTVILIPPPLPPLSQTASTECVDTNTPSKILHTIAIPFME